MSYKIQAPYLVKEVNESIWKKVQIVYQFFSRISHSFFENFLRFWTLFRPQLTSSCLKVLGQIRSN